MALLSTRIQQLTASQTVAMNQRSTDLRNSGIDIINLSVGEPDFFTPNNIKEAAKKAIDQNISHYSPVPGFLALREAVSHKMKRDNNLSYKTEEIMVSNGGKHALSNVITCLVNPGDEVIIPAPYWVSYIELVRLAGGKPVILQSQFDKEYKIDAQELEQAITNKTKAIILCSPSNPSGAVYDKKELSRLASVIVHHQNLFVISDEIYEYINFTEQHESIAQFDEIKDRTIIINGVSKGFAMTGWRIGYTCGPEWLIKGCTKLQGQQTTGANSIAQMAAVEALNNKTDAPAKMTKVFRERRDLVINRLNQIKDIRYVVPQGAFYIFPDISSYYGKKYQEKMISNSTEMSYYLLEEGHIGTVMGDAFGCPDNIRISYSTSDERLEEAMGRMKKVLSKLK